MSNQTPSLKREIGVFGATLMGLGSIIGTGVFVSIGIATGIAGPSVILAVAIGAIVALCNGLSSAQLAANHAVSGGTYEYGYKYLNPTLGFIAGWLFLLAKSASAATAALGFAGYFLNTLGLNSGLLVPTAFIAVIMITVIVLNGIRRSNVANLGIVSLTLFSLILFILTGLPIALSPTGVNNLTPFFTDEKPIAALLQATALMFVAYTGYGRIATLGEEVREPRETIPKAMVVTMIVTMLLYLAVAVVGVAAVGVEGLSDATQKAAPLEVAASQFGIPGIRQIVAVGAITAMLGVLLNLILGLSRVLLAMGRRRDMPPQVARLNASGTTPVIAVIVVAVIIGLLVLIGNVKTTWSFSAFNVLIYYAITNLAALQIPPEERLYPKPIAVIGLVSCFFLAFWVEWQIWLVGLELIAGGLLWRILLDIFQPESR
ncbi:APC family permease [Limnoraphis robusta Tam1]|uniref:APC family permease n=1 Tax=Limnoraphis robusta TaxID=1118279 RepID=UPI002B1E9597|nr:APC family permease [Limnoraphis robusta]MEA5498236.1 APC family permease [Limnoraphis robusta BA-68 BA1]MEA5541420.1 APC family permease [Limnoraphis robusta Tam1]